MRLFSVVLALVVATGCTSNQVSFEHQSQLQTRAKGLALLDDSDVAQVGMGGNTCAVQTNSGVIGADFDVAVGEDDVVQDAIGTATVVVGSAGVYVVDQGFGGFGDPQVRLTDVVQSRLLNDGTVIAVHGQGSDCAIAWEGGGTVPLAGGCGGGVAVDRATGTVFAANGAGLTIADAGGDSIVVPGDFDLVAFDGASEAAYASTGGNSEIHALEADGTPRWAADLGGTITSIDDMGPMGAVAVTMEIDGGIGQLVVLDGATGDQLSQIQLPSAPDQVLVGNNGASMAMVLPNEVHFFSVDLSAQ